MRRIALTIATLSLALTAVLSGCSSPGVAVVDPAPTSHALVSDQDAYRLCVAATDDVDACAADVLGYDMSITPDQVSAQIWDGLLARGWHGDPADDREALYPPVR